MVSEVESTTETEELITETERQRNETESIPAPVGVRADPERTLIGGAAVLLTAIAFIAIAGVPGVAAAIAVLAGWYLLGGTYAFALGQVGVASLLSGAAIAELTTIEVGLLGVLLASTVTLDRYGSESAVLALVWILAGGVLSWMVAQSLVGLSIAGVLLVVATGLAAYILHRYQLVSLGLVGDARE